MATSVPAVSGSVSNGTLSCASGLPLRCRVPLLRSTAVALRAGSAGRPLALIRVRVPAPRCMDNTLRAGQRAMDEEGTWQIGDWWPAVGSRGGPAGC